MMQNLPRWRPALVAGALFWAAAQTFAAATDESPASPMVEVTFRDPANFADVDRDPLARDAWLSDFRGYIARRGTSVLPPGDRLVVTVTDVQRAGQVKPGRLGAFHDIRVVRDDTTPRVALNFQLISSQGAVLKEGSRQLSDIDYLFRSRFHAGTSSEYEKNLIDDWLRQEIGSPRP